MTPEAVFITHNGYRLNQLVFFRHDDPLAAPATCFCVNWRDFARGLSIKENAVFAVGIAMLAVGLGTSIPGIWIPGAALMAAGAIKRV